VEELDVRPNLVNTFVALNAIITLSTPILVHVFSSSCIIFVNPAPGYFGPTKIVSMGVPLYYLFLTAFTSVLALFGVVMSKKWVVARILMAVGNLLILLHSAIGLLGYYNENVMMMFLGLVKGSADWSIQTIYTPFVSIAILGMIISVVGLILARARCRSRKEEINTLSRVNTVNDEKY